MTNQTSRQSIRDVAELENVLSEPTQGVIETLRSLEGDIIVLGVGGKMGPTLARMARRASDLGNVERRIIGVSRFSSSKLEAQLQSCWSLTVFLQQIRSSATKLGYRDIALRHAGSETTGESS